MIRAKRALWEMYSKIGPQTEKAMKRMISGKHIVSDSKEFRFNTIRELLELIKKYGNPNIVKVRNGTEYYVDDDKVIVKYDGELSHRGIVKFLDGMANLRGNSQGQSVYGKQYSVEDKMSSVDENVNFKATDKMTDYVFNWRDTYHNTKEKTTVSANSVGEAIKKFGDLIALGGVGTYNAYVISVSPNDGYIRLYGRLSDLLKQSFKDASGYGADGVVYQKGNFVVIRNNSNPNLYMVVDKDRWNNNKDYNGGGIVAVSLRIAKEDCDHQALLGKLIAKYGEEEGRKRYLAGKNDNCTTVANDAIEYGYIGNAKVVKSLPKIGTPHEFEKMYGRVSKIDFVKKSNESDGTYSIYKVWYKEPESGDLAYFSYAVRDSKKIFSVKVGDKHYVVAAKDKIDAVTKIKSRLIDYVDDKITFKELERIPLEARTEIRKSNNPKAKLLEWESQIDGVVKNAGPNVSSQVKEMAEKIKRDLREFVRTNDKSIQDDVGSEIDKYQMWVDYDMKRYGKISENTMKILHENGLTVVKDQYGDWEVITHTSEDAK